MHYFTYLCVQVPTKVSPLTAGTCPCLLAHLCVLEGWLVPGHAIRIDSMNGSSFQKGKWHGWSHPRSLAAGSGLVAALGWDDLSYKANQLRQETNQEMWPHYPPSRPVLPVTGLIYVRHIHTLGLGHREHGKSHTGSGGFCLT